MQNGETLDLFGSLVPEVKKKRRKKPARLTDNDCPIVLTDDDVLYDPWPHQRQAVKDIKEFIEGPKKPRKRNKVTGEMESQFLAGVVVQPTGVGKSLIIGKAVAENSKERPSLVLQPRGVLLEQNFRQFLLHGGEGSIMSDEFKQRKVSNAVFGTLGSVIAYVDQLKAQGIKDVYIDECFPGSALIATPNGPKKVIEIIQSIETGIEVPVYSYNKRTQETEIRPAIHAFRNGKKAIWQIKVKGQTIETTANHPFFVEKIGWVKAHQLEPGMRLAIGGQRHIKDDNLIIDVIETYKKKDVYNFEVEDTHTYMLCTKKKKKGGFIVHNCHYSYSQRDGSQFMKFIKALQPEKIIGLTATPCRLDKGMLKFITRMKPRIFSKVIHVTQIKDIADNYWAKGFYHIPKFDGSALVNNSTGSNYTKESVKAANKINNVNNKIYWRMKQLIKEEPNEQALVFVESTEVAKKLDELFPNEVRVVTADTKTAVRDEYIKDFKANKFRFMVNVKIFDTGFDYKRLKYAIMGKSTKSFALYYQIIGRIRRKHPDKDQGVLIDYTGNFDRFGPIEKVTIEEYNGHWNIFSGNNLITGYKLDQPTPTKKDLDEKKRFMDLRKARKNMPVMPTASGQLNNQERMVIHQKNKYKYTVFDFGAHRGKEIHAVHTKYLEYILDNFKPNNERNRTIINAVKSVLHRRRMYS